MTTLSGSRSTTRGPAKAPVLFDPTVGAGFGAALEASAAPDSADLAAAFVVEVPLFSKPCRYCLWIRWPRVSSPHKSISAGLISQLCPGVLRLVLLLLAFG